MANTTITTIAVRNILEADRMNHIFLSGEPVYVTDTKQKFMGDGLTVGGEPWGKIRTDIDNIQYENIPNIVLNAHEKKTIQHSGAGTEANYISITENVNKDKYKIALNEPTKYLSVNAKVDSLASLDSTSSDVIQGNESYAAATPVQSTLQIVCDVSVDPPAITSLGGTRTTDGFRVYINNSTSQYIYFGDAVDEADLVVKLQQEIDGLPFSGTCLVSVDANHHIVFDLTCDTHNTRFSTYYNYGTGIGTLNGTEINVYGTPRTTFTTHGIEVSSPSTEVYVNSIDTFRYRTKIATLQPNADLSARYNIFRAKESVYVVTPTFVNGIIDPSQKEKYTNISIDFYDFKFNKLGSVENVDLFDLEDLPSSFLHTMVLYSIHTVYNWGIYYIVADLNIVDNTVIAALSTTSGSFLVIYDIFSNTIISKVTSLEPIYGVAYVSGKYYYMTYDSPTTEVVRLYEISESGETNMIYQFTAANHSYIWQAEVNEVHNGVVFMLIDRFVYLEYATGNITDMSYPVTPMHGATINSYHFNGHDLIIYAAKNSGRIVVAEIHPNGSISTEYTSPNSGIGTYPHGINIYVYESSSDLFIERFYYGNSVTQSYANKIVLDEFLNIVSDLQLDDVFSANAGIGMLANHVYPAYMYGNIYTLSGSVQSLFNINVDGWGEINSIATTNGTPIDTTSTIQFLDSAGGTTLVDYGSPINVSDLALAAVATQSKATFQITGAGGSEYKLEVNGVLIMTNTITYVDMNQCMIAIVNDINATTPIGIDKASVGGIGADTIEIIFSKSVGGDYNGFVLGNTLAGTGVGSNVLGGKNSLLKSVKQQASSVFGFRLDFTTTNNMASPTVSDITFNISNNSVKKVVDHRELDARYDDNFVYLENNTNAKKTINIKLGF